MLSLTDPQLNGCVPGSAGNRGQVELGVHIESESPVGVDVGPEQRAEPPVVVFAE